MLLVVVVLLSLIAIALRGQRVDAGDFGFGSAGLVEAGDTCALFDHSHAAWTVFLSSYVSDGVVDYAGMKRKGQKDLADYLSSLQSVCHGHYEQWSREEKLAFWINAYNAYTIRLILDHYPIDSIRSIGYWP